MVWLKLKLQLTRELFYQTSIINTGNQYVHISHLTYTLKKQCVILLAKLTMICMNQVCQRQKHLLLTKTCSIILGQHLQ